MLAEVARSPARSTVRELPSTARSTVRELPEHLDAVGGPAAEAVEEETEEEEEEEEVCPLEGANFILSLCQHETSSEARVSTGEGLARQGAEQARAGRLRLLRALLVQPGVTFQNIMEELEHSLQEPSAGWRKEVQCLAWGMGVRVPRLQQQRRG
mmetsp:Transcript_72305/g.234843  ORF Transcript_72305/g.234843 Transcript_72305/m.234843 type:complete len:155 (-) Transcript_72305:207-671(-)